MTWLFFFKFCHFTRIIYFKTCSLSIIRWRSFRFYDSHASSWHAFNKTMQIFYGQWLHPRLRTSNNSSSFVSLRSIVIRLSWAHKFSMGFKSGDRAGHFLTVTFLFARYRWTTPLVCLGRYHAEIQNYFHTIDEQKERDGVLKSYGILGQSLFL